MTRFVKSIREMFLFLISIIFHFFNLLDRQRGRSAYPLQAGPCSPIVFLWRELFDHDICSEKDYGLLYEKRYKIIVGSATDKKNCLLYYNKSEFPLADTEGMS